jgi:hypothetical protein
VFSGLTSCQGSPTDSSDINGEVQHQGENIAGYVASTTWDLTNTSHDSSLSIPEDAIWDEATGWWSFTVELDNGQTADVQLQLQDASGQIQQFYQPQTTHRILTRGQGAAPQGSITWDLVLTGARASSNRIVANGSGTVNAQGISGTYQVNSLVLLKEGESYPQSGTITVDLGGDTILVEFNGTSTARATYDTGIISLTFNINLDTGEVSPT